MLFYNRGDALSYFQAIILGIVQGLTEFLPVSSSGHLVLFQHLFGLEGEILVFDILLHFATLLAVIVVFRHKIAELLLGAITDIGQRSPGESVVSAASQSKNIRYIMAIVIGTVPAVVLGLSFKDLFESLFSSIFPVLIALTVTGLILLATFFRRPGDKDVGVGNGFLIGMAQACAIIPGISRSGSTISAALFLGVRRSDAGEFSFLLSLPAICGAVLLAVLDIAECGIDTASLGPWIAGMIAAFLSGYVSLMLLMAVVRRGKIGWFGFYCLALVAAVFILQPEGSKAEHNINEHGDLTVTERLISIPSTYDNSSQPVRVYEAVGKSRPLLIALHTWSHDYSQSDASEYFKRCRERDWHCVFPNFRGPNKTPAACGSPAAMQDILDAVEWAKDNFDVDPRRVFLVGCSGGGYMTLQMAGNFPTVWTAASAWVPISDIARWHEETTERGLVYSQDIELACGGKPGDSPAVDKEYSQRSAVTHLWRAHILPVDINAGIHDGHGGSFGGEGSVPVGQTIRAYNALVKAAGKGGELIGEDIIAAIEKDEAVPPGTRTDTNEDATYGRRIHLRRSSGLSRMTLFEGGHEIVYDAVFAWLEQF